MIVSYPFPVVKTDLPRHHTQAPRSDYWAPSILDREIEKRLTLKRWRVGQVVRCRGWTRKQIYNAVFQANHQAEVHGKHTRCYEFEYTNDPEVSLIRRLF